MFSCDSVSTRWCHPEPKLLPGWHPCWQVQIERNDLFQKWFAHGDGIEGKRTQATPKPPGVCDTVESYPSATRPPSTVFAGADRAGVFGRPGGMIAEEASRPGGASRAPGAVFSDCSTACSAADARPGEGFTLVDSTSAVFEEGVVHAVEVGSGTRQTGDAGKASPSPANAPADALGATDVPIEQMDHIPPRVPPCILGSAIERSIYATKRAFEQALVNNGVPEPWLLMERFGDAILEEVLQESAADLFRSCDDFVERLADDEFQPAEVEHVDQGVA